jgi:hypothetical protein
VPQTPVAVPGWQAPLASQQPWQLVGPHGDTHAPFWQGWPMSSQLMQTWSSLQNWQARPQSAAVQQPPGKQARSHSR